MSYKKRKERGLHVRNHREKGKKIQYKNISCSLGMSKCLIFLTLFINEIPDNEKNASNKQKIYIMFKI